MLTAAAAAFLLGCLDRPDLDWGDNGAERSPDANSSNRADAAVTSSERCDPVTQRANVPGPFTCGAPGAAWDGDFVTLGAAGRRFDIFTYEASHPTATPTVAYPCADAPTTIYPPEAPAEPCSVAGVRPWHSVRWAEADAACRSIGWRLCTGDELNRACGGAQLSTYTWGANFVGGNCNFRNGYIAEGADAASEAPAGHFPECVSPDGVHDANGNLWEWVSDRDAADEHARYNQGGGWRIIAQRHQDQYLTCAQQTRLPGFSARTYANGDVGFRCCRDTP